MAWSYEVTRAPTSTVTELSYGYTITTSQSASVTSSNTISQQTINSSHSYSEGETGSKCCFGTGGASFTYLAGTDTLTAFETWQIRTESVTRGSHATQTFQQASAYTAGTSSFTAYFTFSLETHISYSSSNRYFAGEATDGVTEFTSYSSFVLRTFSTVDHTGGTTTSTSSTAFTSSSSASYGRTPRTYQYVGTTVTDTVTITNTVTTGFLSTYTQVTSTTGPTTTTFTDTTAATTTTTETTTTTSVGTSMSTNDKVALYDLIFHADSMDWAWETTTSGNDMIPALATEVNDTTFSQRAVGVTRPAEPATTATFTWSRANGVLSSANTTFSDSYWFADTTTATFAIRTTSSSTYAIGAATTSSNQISLTTEVTLTRFFTTTTQTTYTFHTTSLFTDTNTSSVILSLCTYYYTYSDTLTSTRTDEPITFTTTYLAGSYVQSWLVGARASSYTSQQTTTSSGGTTVAAGGTSYANLDFSNLNDNYADSSIDNRAFISSTQAPATISFLKDDVAGGFQPWSATAFGGNYGTNLSVAGFQVPVLSFGHIYPNIIVPLMDGETRAFTQGTTTATTQYVSSADEVRITQQTGIDTSDTAASTLTISSIGTIDNSQSSINSVSSTIGGFGWKRATSDSSFLSCEYGVHSYTSMDSTLGTTRSTTSWGPVHSLAHGNAMNFESVPAINIQPTYSVTRHGFVTVLPAFPST